MEPIHLIAALLIYAFIITWLSKRFHVKLIKTRKINNEVKHLLDWEDRKDIDFWEKQWHKIYYWIILVVFAFPVYMAFPITTLFPLYPYTLIPILTLIAMGSLYWLGDIIINKLMDWDTFYRGNEFWDNVPFWVRFIVFALSLTGAILCAL